MDSIIWRINFAFAQRKCKCGEPYNRKHINQCNLLSSDPKYSEAKDSDEFTEHLERVKKLFKDVKKLITESVHYTVLDFALDVMDYELFNHCFGLLKVALNATH